MTKFRHGDIIKYHNPKWTKLNGSIGYIDARGLLDNEADGHVLYGLTFIAFPAGATDWGFGSQCGGEAEYMTLLGHMEGV